MLSLAWKGNRDATGQVRGEGEGRGEGRLALHQRSSLPRGNQRLWKDKGRDGVQRCALSPRKHLLFFSPQLGSGGEPVRWQHASPGRRSPPDPARSALLQRGPDGN